MVYLNKLIGYEINEKITGPDAISKCFERNELPLSIPSWPNMKEELENGFYFWDMVFTVFKKRYSIYYYFC